MEKFIKINKTEASDKKIPKYLYIANQSKAPRIIIQQYKLSKQVEKKSSKRKEPSSDGYKEGTRFYFLE